MTTQEYTLKYNLQDKLDYIKGMGFDAIWISPIPENYGNDYHGYGALDWYKVNPHFGDEQGLKDMIKAAQEKGIWVMLDVVANHVAWIDEAYQMVNPFNKKEYYHAKCQINNWDDHIIRAIKFPPQTLLYSEACLISYQMLIYTTVPHDIFSSPYFTSGEQVQRHLPSLNPGPKISDLDTNSFGPKGLPLFKGDVGYVSYYTHDGLDATMNYPLYFTLRNVFNYKHSMYEIRNVFNQEKSAFADVDALGVFIDNHDNPRFLSMSNSLPLFKTALTFTLFSQGIPIIYYGSEQGFNGGNDPANREPLWTSMNTQNPLYTFLQGLISLRKSQEVWTFPHIERWCDDTFYAFTRGNVLITITNQDQSGQQHRDISYHPYKPGQKLCNQLFEGDCIFVTPDNKVPVYLLNGESKVFIPATNAEGEYIFAQE